MNVSVAVVGAGINGLATAYHLARLMGGADVALVDRFATGHARGSSHGKERITRSSYAAAHWVADMQRCHREHWPQLETALGCRLVFRGPGAVFFGPAGGPLDNYARAVDEVGADVATLSPGDARAIFPTMRFDGCDRVLHDRTAGVIAAGAATRGLERWLVDAGVTLRRPVRVRALEQGGDGVRLVGTDILARLVVVATGPWIGELVPTLAVRPARQHVGYWHFPGASTATTPAWVHLGHDGLHYGLPTLAGGEMKAAFHAPGEGVGDDPGADGAASGPADSSRVAAVDAELRRWFTPALGNLARTETCFYTVRDDDEFVQGWVSERVYALSACSGHAFKLAPLTGERVAAAVTARL